MSEIEEESIRKQAEIILIMEYKIIREELKEKVDKIKKTMNEKSYQMKRKKTGEKE